MNTCWKAFLIIPFVLAFFTACQKGPVENVVISKNDGTFDISLIQSATDVTEVVQDSTADAETTSNADVSHNYQYEKKFVSTDGSVVFHIGLDEDFLFTSMPVVEVEPHFLTEEDAQRVARALLEDAVFYEAEPIMSPVYSKSEIQEKINRWSSYNGEGITWGNYEEARTRYIQEYSLLMESAPETNPHIICPWTFKKTTFYVQSAEDAEAANTSDDNDEIRATARVNGIPYLFQIATRNRSNFKLNQIYLDIYDGPSPSNADRNIFQAQLCQTDAPTSENLKLIQEKAAAMLAQMDLGEWQIDRCFVDTEYRNGTEEYIVVVTAVPSFQNVTVCRRPQLNNLKSNAVYASNYYLTDTLFKFSVNGELLYFEMYSPVDVKNVINPNVLVLSVDELMQIAVNHLSLSDAHAYDNMQYLDSGIELDCSVSVCHADYGLSRVKVPNTDESYYYVPAIIFWGKTEFTDPSTGQSVGSSEDESPLLILNAIDGSVINSTNE